MLNKLICRLFGHPTFKLYKVKGERLRLRSSYTSSDTYDCERCHKRLRVKLVEIHLG